MKINKFTAIAGGLAAAAALSAAAPASAATIVKAFIGGPFSVANPLGTLPAERLVAGNTYDDTFSVVAGGGSVLTQVQASIKGPVSEDIQYSLYSGAPGSGTLIDTSALGVGPSLTNTLGTGSYYVQIDFIAKSNELLSGGLAVSAIPEPATWAMMLVGFGALGGMVRASRKQALATA
jgi:hypothetical protein